MPTVQQSRRGEDMTYIVSGRLGRNYIPGWIYIPYFSWTWARKHVALTTTSSHVATQKETLECKWWEEMEDSGSLMPPMSHKSHHQELALTAFPVILGCKLPYYWSRPGFSVKVYCYLQLNIPSDTTANTLSSVSMVLYLYVFDYTVFYTVLKVLLIAIYSFTVLELTIATIYETVHSEWDYRLKLINFPITQKLYFHLSHFRT